MKEKVKGLFLLPPEIRDAFLRDSVRKNRTAAQTVCVFIVLIELFNICRVLLWSKSGLGTQNNRIYFGLYVLLLVMGLLFLAAHWALRYRPTALYRTQMGGAVFLLLWCTALNTYDVISEGDMNTTVLVTAMLGVAVLVQAEPVRLLPAFLASYLIFLACTAAYVDVGTLLNLTVALVTTALAGVAHFHYASAYLTQREKIIQMNQRLLDERSRLRLSLEQYRILMDQARDILFRWEPESDRMEFSSNWTELFDAPQVISHFRAWSEQDEPINRALGGRVWAWMEAYQAGQPPRRYELSLCRADTGQVRWYQMRMTMQADSAGRPIQALGVLRDVSEHQSEIEQLQSRLQKDQLTGILNKTAVEAYARRELQAMGADGDLAVLMMDLDDFKRINDTWGHPCGDYVLSEMARIMREIFRGSDGLGRIGGDEFIVVLPGLGDRDVLREKASRFMERLGEIRWQGEPLSLGCSIGGVVVSGPAEFETVYHRVDDALYQAKSQGKDRLVLLDQI